MFKDLHAAPAIAAITVVDHAAAVSTRCANGCRTSQANRNLEPSWPAKNGALRDKKAAFRQPEILQHGILHASRRPGGGQSKGHRNRRKKRKSEDHWQ